MAPGPHTGSADGAAPALSASYFRGLLTSETARLADLCETWEAKLASISGGSEDACGQVRTAIGQARLLTNRKGRFEQFSGLIDACEGNKGEKKTTVTDLQGFWEMIYFQVSINDFANCNIRLYYVQGNSRTFYIKMLER